jgi:hypothetical protein
LLAGAIRKEEPWCKQRDPEGQCRERRQRESDQEAPASGAKPRRRSEGDGFIHDRAQGDWSCNKYDTCDVPERVRHLVPVSSQVHLLVVTVEAPFDAVEDRDCRDDDCQADQREAEGGRG